MIDITWQFEFASSWIDRTEQGRVPHAVMLAGPAGVGKRAAAAWMVARQLRMQSARDRPQYPFDRPEHPDLRWIEAPEGKQAIGIEQIRELVGELSLTSYAGGGKAAVIDPANAMTTNAANSLLKTLEEPPGDTLIVLIADRTGHLPATIFSRCQRINFAPPPVAEGLAWLERLQHDNDWAEALRVAGGAPLAAIAAVQQLDTSNAMARDFAAVAGGRASPVEVAARWAKIEPGFVLDWLARQVQDAAKTTSGSRNSVAGLAIDESVLRRMDMRKLFCYLDIINRVRGQGAGSYNVQLTLESLLIDWSEGLANCGQDPQLEAKWQLSATR
jgi:DNA polymerase-3 subunit delta'